MVGSMEEMAYIFGMIFILSNKLQIVGDRIDPLLTVKQWFLIVGVLQCENDAPTLSEVASRIGSSRQNVKKMALVLEKRGFVSMEKDPNDARIVRIRPTELCVEHLKTRDIKERLFLERLFDGIKSEDLKTLSVVVKKLEKNLFEMELSHEK